MTNKMAINYEILRGYGISLKSVIKEFQKKFEACQEYCQDVLGVRLTLTWKIHIIAVHLPHLPQFLSIAKCGMARFAEQAIESAHADFKKTYARFRVAESHRIQTGP